METEKVTNCQSNNAALQDGACTLAAAAWMYAVLETVFCHLQICRHGCECMCVPNHTKLVATSHIT